MNTPRKQHYSYLIYPEPILTKAIFDYRGIARIRKKIVQDGAELFFHSRYPLDTVIGEFNNYLIQLLNRSPT